MNDELKTEEFKPKRSYKGLIIFILIIIFIGGVFFSIHKYIEYRNNKKIEERKKLAEENPLNSELDNLYAFGITDNYIVGIKKDGTFTKIYNLLQGTGQFGDFTNYFYYNKKLYLLFSDNNIYTIDLDKGNKVYEVEKYYEIEPAICPDVYDESKNILQVSDLAFRNKTVYLNGAPCGAGTVSMVRYSVKTKQNEMSTVKSYDTSYVDMEYKSGMLFIHANNSIYMYDLKNKTEETVAENINSDDKIVLKNNILVYTNYVDNVKNYIGYNIKTKEKADITNIANELLIYNRSFIYHNGNTIYKKGSREKEIYKAHYDTLSNLELVGEKILQIVDTSSEDASLRRVINIDLGNNYKTNTVENEFDNIVIYE